MSDHHQSFISKYIFSTDHKWIARQYLVTGLVMALVGGFLSYVFRMQLAWPGDSVPGFGPVGAGVYNSLVTMHGTIMIFWVAMPILLAAFGNFLIPLMVGAEDMAFPKLNMASYWVFLLSTIVLVASFFVPGGAAAGGWTMYPPLAGNGDFSGVYLGGHLWIVAVALEFVSMLMGGINFLTTAMCMRAPGLTIWRLPMVIWMQVAANLLFVFSVGPLIAGAIMMLFDRTLGTGFYVPEQGGDPLLWQHLFWFFGHPEVYVILLPGLGIISEIIPVFARKPLFGYKTIIWSVLGASLLSFIVWAHHQYISGIDPRLALPFSITTILISVPFAIILFCYLATLYKSSITFSPAMLFSLGVIGEFFIGGVTGILLGSPAADIYFHDTYFVVAHFHYTLFPSVIFAMFAGIYYWYPKATGKHLSKGLGIIHFAGTTLFFNVVFIPQFFMGIAGHHRRIANPLEFEQLRELSGLQAMSTVGVIGLLTFQLFFIVNFFKSYFTGKKSSENPWEASSLEWACPSPPPHGNFAETPKVYRGPYEFSADYQDSDFKLQSQQ